MNFRARLTELRTGFIRTFWVANTLELFERFAFYGSKAVLTVYLAEKVGLGTNRAGQLAGLFSGVLYSLPILAGTVVDRYGFKKSLAACFSFFCLGYFLIGLAGLQFGQAITEAIGKEPYVIGVLLLTAIGGSLIKPCIVGTVARTTTPDSKSLGYSIYYTLVNIGGAVGPILASQVRLGLGIEYVLIMSSATSGLLLLGTLLFFREPPRGADEKPPTSMARVLADMLLVFRNLRFITFLVIFSGFWIMFWQIFYSLPFFVKDVLHYERFELIETVDAWTVIILAVPVTALMGKLRPILAMTGGFAIASASWLLLGFFPTLPATIAGIALYAIGEAMQAPRFYEYVSDLAPKEQVGTFMGFAFLPVAIGSFVGGPLGGYLAKHYVEQSHRPLAMWGMVSAIGAASTILMLLYDRFLAPRKTR